MLRLGGDAERVAQSDTSGLSSVFRAKFVDGLRKAFQEGKLVFSGSAAQLANPKRFAVFVDSLFKQRWVVYAKPALGRPPRCSVTLAGTRTASPSAITAYWLSTERKSPSAGRTTRMAKSRRK